MLVYLYNTQGHINDCLCKFFFIVLLGLECVIFCLSDSTALSRLSEAATGGVLQQKFRNIHEKTLVSESLFNKLAGIHAWRFTKKRLQHRSFPMNLANFLRTAFFIEHLSWLLPLENGWVNFLSKSLSKLKF